MTGTLTMNLIGSLVLGIFGILAFLWALKGGQFEDENKFTHGALFDGEDELNRAIDKEKKLKEYKNKKEEEAK